VNLQLNQIFLSSQEAMIERIFIIIIVGFVRLLLRKAQRKGLLFAAKANAKAP
jgi:hypothetical protein